MPGPAPVRHGLGFLTELLGSRASAPGRWQPVPAVQYSDHQPGQLRLSDIPARDRLGGRAAVALAEGGSVLRVFLNRGFINHAYSGAAS